MYSPIPWAVAITRSPLRATTARPLMVRLTALGSGGGAAASVPGSVVVMTRPRCDGYEVASHDLGLELVAEQREGRMHRSIGRWPHEADGCHLVREGHCIEAETIAGRVREITGADRFTDFDQLVEVARGAVT